MAFTWHTIAGNKEVGTSGGGKFQVTRLPDWQYVVWYRKRAKQPGREWIWVTDSAGNPRTFDTVDEAVEEAVKQRKELLRRSLGPTTG